jgi:hypothetical protein
MPDGGSAHRSPPHTVIRTQRSLLDRYATGNARAEAMKLWVQSLKYLVAARRNSVGGFGAESSQMTADSIALMTAEECRLPAALLTD